MENKKSVLEINRTGGLNKQNHLKETNFDKDVFCFFPYPIRQNISKCMKIDQTLAFQMTPSLTITVEKDPLALGLSPTHRSVARRRIVPDNSSIVQARHQ